MAESTAKIAEAETQKAKAAQLNVQLKSKIEFQKNKLALHKQQSDNEIAALKQELEEAKIIVDSGEGNKEIVFKYTELKEKMKLERERIAAQAKAAEDNNDNKEDDNGE
ncbi:MAG: hypothetical protein DRI97_06570 [Bacteroidetes bacterium]|nr:MAG: hypothetical protein DRI97_06570 [Bacteroidota bacterium]